MQEFWIFWIRHVIILGSRIINGGFARAHDFKGYDQHVTNPKGSNSCSKKYN